MRSIFRGRDQAGRTGLRTLVVGAGDAGRTLVRDLRGTAGYGLCPVGFLDDDTGLRGVCGLPVLGPLSSLRAVVVAGDIQAVVVAIPSLPATTVRALAEAAAAACVPIRVLPSFLAAVERDARASDLTSLRIDQLLGRDERHLRAGALKSPVSGRRVLVTGAGGSIGSEICRQVRAFGPAALCLLDHDETNLHTLQLEITGEALLDTDELVIGDIRDRSRMDQVIGQFRPDLVLHAAAHKHLPLLERHPCEGVKTNVLGTMILAEAAQRAGVERFLLISTDKAADPTSILGVTKRLAELVVQSYAGSGTEFASVRFGNVLGSRGSFLHVVADQVRRGEPVTVTHPDVTRYFMTVEEAVHLVLAAVGMAEGGETFVLDMGEPVRIVDMVSKYAEQMHVGDVTIRYTGLRPGEKLNETLFSLTENCVPTAHEKVLAVPGGGIDPSFRDRLAPLFLAAEINDPAEVRERLHELVPEYHPSIAVPQPRQAALALSAPYPDGF
jgi:FlaA1/EpsC-like NDP-sugar epimerase